MGFLKKQSIRLMRESWQDANELAEEMRAIFNSEEPIVFDQPITINNNTSQPGITINNGGDGPVIQVNNNPEPPIQFPDYPPITIPDFPNIPPTIIYNNDGTVTDGDGDPVDNGGGGTTTGGSVFPGKIISGASGIYQVAVYEDGLANAPVTRTVIQLSMDLSDVIAPDNWAIIGKLNNSYFMQFPIWYADA
jgi:hypothetical protein